MKSLRKGFTLVELMVVIVIIGILAALAIPRFLGATAKAKATEFKPVLKQLSTLEEAYKQERDVYASVTTSIGFDAPGGGTARFNYDINSAATNTFSLVATLNTTLGTVPSGAQAIWSHDATITTASQQDTKSYGGATGSQSLTQLANWQ